MTKEVWSLWVFVVTERPLMTVIVIIKVEKLRIEGNESKQETIR